MDEHWTDTALLERLLAREALDPAHCTRCAERAETIARRIDPLRSEGMPEPFDNQFYRRQAALIRTRIAAGEGRRPLHRGVFRLPRLAWIGGAMAAAVMLTVVLHGRIPTSPRGRTDQPTIVASNDFASDQDLTDDRLLREVDDLLDEQP